MHNVQFQLYMLEGDLRFVIPVAMDGNSADLPKPACRPWRWIPANPWPE